MSDQIESPDKVAEIRRRAMRVKDLGGMIPSPTYVADVGHLLIENDGLKSELEMEREAARTNFEVYQRAQDEIDSLTAEIVLLRKGR